MAHAELGHGPNHWRRYPLHEAGTFLSGKKGSALERRSLLPPIPKVASAPYPPAKITDETAHRREGWWKDVRGSAFEPA